MHNEIGMARLSAALAQRHRVTLCGEGADELFLGYGRIYRSGFDWVRGRLLRRLGAAGERAREKLGIRRRLSSELDFFLDGFTYWSWDDKAPLLTPEVRRAAAEDVEATDVIRASFDRARRRGAMGRIAQVFIDIHLPNLLMMVDATTMMSSVEARVPYLDHRIAEAAWAIPESSRLAWRNRLAPVRALVRPIATFSETLDEPKAHLRRTWAADLPSMVLRRRKMGFPMPLGAWLATERREEIVSEICRPGSKLGAVFDLVKLARWAREHDVSDGFGQRLWRLYSLERFAAMWF
jgi:asparagine synthase (glutamine-hydrolysing)